MWKRYISAASLEDALDGLTIYGPSARIVAGATDLILELERGVRKGVETVIDITRIPALNYITEDSEGVIHLGAMVTHNDCAASSLIREKAYPLGQAAWEVGSPQIRNRATVAGNLVTASPANDTITPLMALEASVVLRSKTSERIVPLNSFYTGVRKTVMRPEEILVEIRFPGMNRNSRGAYIKYALRSAQAISLVNISVVLMFGNDSAIEKASITLGAVAPTIIHAYEAEEFLISKKLDEINFDKVADLVTSEIHPIDDVRASAGYRRKIASVITKRALKVIKSGKEWNNYPQNPILLHVEQECSGPIQSVTHVSGDPIITQINGKEYRFLHGNHKSLLRLLREEGFLVGTKEGCAEGECGACTVHLDGSAVMSCMVPAPRAHGAVITTIEGLARDGVLHPLQKAFVDEGAVQCGYCTPGFLMSGAMLLEEKPEPDRSDILQAFTGNLCRCTGYYKIIQSVESAIQARRDP
jgi:xanthine dehydrogenase iron-sulfur cluster and FAD-binding subunit A